MRACVSEPGSAQGTGHQACSACLPACRTSHRAGSPTQTSTAGLEGLRADPGSDQSLVSCAALQRLGRRGCERGDDDAGGSQRCTASARLHSRWWVPECSDGLAEHRAAGAHPARAAESGEPASAPAARACLSDAQPGAPETKCATAHTGQSSSGHTQRAAANPAQPGPAASTQSGRGAAHVSSALCRAVEQLGVPGARAGTQTPASPGSAGVVWLGCPAGALTARSALAPLPGSFDADVPCQLLAWAPCQPLSSAWPGWRPSWWWCVRLLLAAAPRAHEAGQSGPGQQRSINASVPLFVLLLWARSAQIGLWPNVDHNLCSGEGFRCCLQLCADLFVDVMLSHALGTLCAPSSSLMCSAGRLAALAGPLLCCSAVPLSLRLMVKAGVEKTRMCDTLRPAGPAARCCACRLPLGFALDTTRLHGRPPCLVGHARACTRPLPRSHLRLLDWTLRVRPLLGVHGVHAACLLPEVTTCTPRTHSDTATAGLRLPQKLDQRTTPHPHASLWQ